jgi:RNA-directed DNA polymerase
VKHKKVLERVYNPGRLRMAWQQVRKNAGAAGIDKMTVEAFERREDELLKLIHDKLKAGTYRFKPARRALIPKEGSSKKRKLGIPVVMDRIVSQSMNLVFEGIFDLAFTESNFGFRRGRSQHRAIKHVQAIVLEGYEWCASIVSFRQACMTWSENPYKMGYPKFSGRIVHGQPKSKSAVHPQKSSSPV